MSSVSLTFPCYFRPPMDFPSLYSVHWSKKEGRIEAGRENRSDKKVPRKEERIEEGRKNRRRARVEERRMNRIKKKADCVFGSPDGYVIRNCSAYRSQ